ncbi:MAG: hypothetical protein ACREJQ_07615, partial [bacterium]
MDKSVVNRLIKMLGLVLCFVLSLIGATTRERNFHWPVKVPRWYAAEYKDYALSVTQQALLIAAIKKYYLMNGKAPNSYKELADSGALLFQPLNFITGQPVRGDGSMGDVVIASNGPIVTIECFHGVPPGPNRAAHLKHVSLEMDTRKYSPNIYYVPKRGAIKDPLNPMWGYDKIPITDMASWISTLNATMLAEGIQTIVLLDGSQGGTRWTPDLTSDRVFARLKKIVAGWKNPYTGEALKLWPAKSAVAGDLGWFYHHASNQMVLET